MLDTQIPRTKRIESLLAIALAESGGSASGFIFKAIAFTFTTPSPFVLHAIAPGQSISRAGVIIDTTFDGIGASLSVGTPASPQLFLATADNFPSVLGQYESDKVTPFAIGDTIQLTINPGAAPTQGAGFVFYALG